MVTDHTPETLRAFEAQIAGDFDLGRIRAPVHLAGGNEKELIDIFHSVRPEDWVLCQWRSHYHCILKGVPLEKLRADILEGRSITLCYPEYRILSSAIVGGTVPIGVGLAMGIKRAGGSEKVWCFVGDMTAHTGIFHECHQYAVWNDLPIMFVVENNGLSVCTNTRKAWGIGSIKIGHIKHKIMQYEYALPWPHSGAGKRVQF